MNTITPLIFLALAFGLLLAIRIVFLLIIRAGETKKAPRVDGSQPAVINQDLFASKSKEPAR